MILTVSSVRSTHFILQTGLKLEIQSSGLMDLGK